MAIPRFHETAGIQFVSFSKIISEFTPLIKQRRSQYHIYGDNLRKLKTVMEKLKEQNYKNVIKRITTEMIYKEQCLADLSIQTGNLDWLTILPITKFGLELTKQQTAIWLGNHKSINNLSYMILEAA